MKCYGILGGTQLRSNEMQLRYTSPLFIGGSVVVVTVVFATAAAAVGRLVVVFICLSHFIISSPPRFFPQRPLYVGART